MGKKYSSEEGVTYHKKEEGKKSNIETKFDKFGNQVSIIETSNKFDDEKVTNEKNISLSGDPTGSFPSGVVETSDKNNTSLMIEAEETPPKQNTENLKYDAVLFF